VTGVQTCALPISSSPPSTPHTRILIVWGITAVAVNPDLYVQAAALIATAAPLRYRELTGQRNTREAMPSFRRDTTCGARHGPRRPPSNAAVLQAPRGRRVGFPIQGGPHMADPRQQPEWLTAGNTRHLLRSGSRTLSV